MPAIVDVLGNQKKRKRDDVESNFNKYKKHIIDGESSPENFQSEVLLLEKEILESRKNYNSISTLLEHINVQDVSNQRDVVAAVALCRVFCRLMTAGHLSKSKDSSDNEVTIVKWLKQRMEEYENALLKKLAASDAPSQNAVLTILMRLMKEEAKHLKLSDHEIWSTGVFEKTVRVLVETADVEEARLEFLEKYVGEYEDIRYHFFARLPDIMSNTARKTTLQNGLSMLAAIDNIPEQQKEFEDFFLDAPSKKKHELYSLTAHKKQAQRAWLAIMRQDLGKAQRKTILNLISHRIAPCFLKLELLMDFLTDSFDVGGSTSLMALSGLFYLLQNKNLDYPQFYPKVYSLIDANILHSKHRSRFIRLLDTFLASTHLPAALVASFMKRLSRLCLFAPPSGIVVVVPWIYNLLKNHPSCTFMIHRQAELPDKNEEGWGDPFRVEEPNPMETDAIQSSLWEVHTLQSHYHPNVATIAKIISEQFTKEAYNLEDFLDHSYATMLDAELSKDIKKHPEIEYEIPKSIFTKRDSELEKQDSLLVNLWAFG